MVNSPRTCPPTKARGTTGWRERGYARFFWKVGPVVVVNKSRFFRMGFGDRPPRSPVGQAVPDSLGCQAQPDLRFRGKWGLAPWHKPVWHKRKRCRHGASPLFPQALPRGPVGKGDRHRRQRRCPAGPACLRRRCQSPFPTADPYSMKRRSNRPFSTLMSWPRWKPTGMVRS